MGSLRVKIQRAEEIRGLCGTCSFYTHRATERETAHECMRWEKPLTGEPILSCGSYDRRTNITFYGDAWEPVYDKTGNLKTFEAPKPRRR